MTGGWQDPYCIPGSRTLINKLGERDAEILAVTEVQVTTARLLQLAQRPIGGSFDLGHRQAIHRHIFQDIYEWAGQMRTVEIGKGSTQFMPHSMIPRVLPPTGA